MEEQNNQQENSLNQAHQGGSQSQPPPPPPPSDIPPQSQASPEQEPQKQSATMGQKIILTLLVLIVLGLLGFGVYVANQKGLLPTFFSRAPYTQENLLTKAPLKLREINTGSFTASFLFKDEERDADATPLAFDNEAIEREREAKRPLYERDKLRADILRDLSFDFRYSRDPYPVSLSVLSEPEYQSVKDSFSYKRTLGGEGYELVVTFETNEAIERFNSYNRYSSVYGEYDVNGKTVVITHENTIPYLYVSAEPPKPLLVSFAEGLEELYKALPGNTILEASMQGRSDIVEGEGRDQDINGEVVFDAFAQFEDSSYAFNMEFKAVDSVLYYRINKFPGIPGLGSFFNISEIKGKWVSITEEDLADLEQSTQSSYFTQGFSDLIKEQKELTQDQQAALDFYEEVGELLLDSNLVYVSSGPVQEDIEETTTYKYTLGINKESIVPFVRGTRDALQNYAHNSRASSSLNIMLSEGNTQELIDAFESEEFANIYDYLSNNSSLSLWFTEDGFPHRVTYSLRLVPLSEEPPLSEKQYRFELSYDLENINAPTEIKAPSEAIPLSDAFEILVGESLKTARTAATNAAIKANLSGVRVSAELYYDENNNSYGPLRIESFCSEHIKVSGNLFSDTNIKSALEELQTLIDEDENGRCGATNSSYAVAFPLMEIDSVPANSYFCVDSTGAAKTITTTNTKNIITGVSSRGEPYECGN